MRSSTLLALVLFSTGCTAVFGSWSFDDTDAGPGPIDAAVDAGPAFDAGPGLDAGPRPDGAPLDAGPLPRDGGTDAGALPTPPDARRWTAPTDLRVRGAARRGAGGVLTVGTTEQLPGTSRDGWAVWYDDSGVRWSQFFRGITNDQLNSVGVRGSDLMIAGSTRSVHVGTSRNSDVLLLQPGDAGITGGWHYGTTDEEALWTLFDGGSLAAWIGVGYVGDTGPTRDGLVVAFDASVTPLWAARFDAGDAENFNAGVVADGRVYVAGESGGSGARRALVAAVSPTGVLWAKWTGPGDNTTTHAYVDGAGVVHMTARVGAAALLDVTPDGDITGVTLPSSGRLTGIVDTGGASALTIAQWNGSAFDVLLARREGQRITTRTLAAGIATPGFLPAPIVDADGVTRIVVEAPSGLADIPFNAAPESSCLGGPSVGTSGLVLSGDFTDATLTRTPMSFTGGAVSPLPLANLGLTSAASCP